MTTYRIVQQHGLFRAQELIESHPGEVWRDIPESSHKDYFEVEKALQEMVEATKITEVKRIML